MLRSTEGRSRMIRTMLGERKMTAEIPTVASEVPQLLQCSACTHAIAPSAASCPKCGAMNTYEHPKITSMKRLRLDEKVGFDYEATSLVVEGKMHSSTELFGILPFLSILAAIVVGFFGGLLSFSGLLLAAAQLLCGFLFIAGMAGIGVFILKLIFGRPADTFRIEFVSGSPVWTSTNDQAWAPVKKHFLG